MLPLGSQLSNNFGETSDGILSIAMEAGRYVIENLQINLPNGKLLFSKLMKLSVE